MAEVLTPDICVIGGGPGGIAVATRAAASAVPVVLVEKDRMGGANLAYGGVPAAALFAAASNYEALRRGPAIGVSGAPLQVNLGKVSDHVRSVMESVAPNVSAERLSALGVRVVQAAAHFADRRTLVAGNVVVRARRFVIATGALPAVPELPGLANVEYLTVDNAFDLGKKPTHLIVVGANPHGLELAQAYARLGVDVTVIDEAPALAEDDPELAALFLDRFRADGIRVRDNVRIAAIGRRRGGIRVVLGVDDAPVDGSHLLVAGGRAPNIAGLGLDVARIAYHLEGITVDRHLRTTNRRVYAIGDVIAGPALANRADYQADRVVRNILFRLPFREHSSYAPTVMFTDPGLASVGMTETIARRRYQNIRVLRLPLGDNDRAAAERMSSGLVKVITTRRGRILGAGIAGHDAGEQIALWSLALSQGLSVRDMLDFVPPYPARAEAARRVAASFDGPGLTSPWRRRIIEFLRKFG
jgi:pyruvate/2-oxoglutarate dehydrogenase complex dihydrolipoamide dehydrogenase (E3) component